MKSIKFKTLFFVLCLLAFLFIFQWYFINYFLKGALEKQLINFMANIGQSVTGEIDTRHLQVFEGFDTTVTYSRLKERLEHYLEDFNIDNISIIDTNKKVVIDLKSGLKNGDDFGYLDLNEIQFNALKSGVIKRSSLYKNVYGKYTENVYIPVFTPKRECAGILILSASARFLNSIEDFRKNILWLYISLIVLSLGLGFLLSSSFAQPVINLSKIVDRIGGGDYRSPIPYRKRNDELGHLARKITEMMRKIELRDLFMRKISAGIAHEIRNPLTAIKGNLMLIKRKSNGKEIGEMIDDNLKQVDALEELVADFMNFAKPVTLDMKHIRIGEVLGYALKETEILRGQKEVELFYECPDDALIEGDMNYLKRALVNLIRNAAEAVPVGGMIEITCRSADGKLTLYIKDYGAGIDPEDADRIFEPFFTTKTTGTGLGLSIVKEIMEKHGGSIDFESVKGEYTRFRIEMPLARRDYA